MVHSEHIDFSFRGRYSMIGTPSDEIRELIYVLHGHGQQARYFIRKFQALASEQRLLMAPEGLSRYYLEGFTGRVGATWMTRDDRETDIFNYVNFLNALHEQVATQLPAGVSITVIGFSQGAATATRWLMDGKVAAQRFILWAGILPYDMDISHAEERLGSMEKYYVYGLQDPFVNDEKKDEMEKLMKGGNLRFVEITFQGAHDIEQETLENLFRVSADNRG